MDETEPDNADVIDLVVKLCTRIGMIMEDVSPLALDASRGGMEFRVVDFARDPGDDHARRCR